MTKLSIVSPPSHCMMVSRIYLVTNDMILCFIIMSVFRLRFFIGVTEKKMER